MHHLYLNPMNIKILPFCIALAAGALSATLAPAQDLKSVLTGVIKNVAGDKTTTETSIIGTWTYVGPECQFESENLLTKAGGEAAAKKVEEKMAPVYKKAGLEGCTYTFNEDGTYTSTIKGKATNGTYTFDAEKKTVTMKGKLGIKTTAYVTVVGSSMSLVYNADKLMSALQAVSGSLSGLNSTASTINSLAKQYKGLRLGFELKK